MSESWAPEPGGPYEIPEHLYHADKTALSSSGARTLTDSCPEKFAYDREHGRPDKPHFDEGRAAHLEVLGVGAPLYVPRDSDGQPYAEWRTDDAKAQVKAARLRGDTPVKDVVAKRVAAMARKLREHPTAGPLLARPGKAEQTFVARDPDKNEVLLKARIDWMPDVEPGQRLILVDYKGTTCAQPSAFERRMADLGYDQQGDFYRVVVAAALNLVLPPVFVLIAQEKEAPYLVSVHEPQGYVLDGAHELNREAISTYARCMKSGVWPGYNPNPHRADAPGWRCAAYEAAAVRNLARRDEELIGVPA